MIVFVPSGRFVGTERAVRGSQPGSYGQPFAENTTLRGFDA